MKRIIILQGLPGSGKSTWAKQYVAEKPTERIRINKDDIRRMLGIYWIPEREGLVQSIVDNTIKEAMKQGYEIVVDNMNLNVDEVRNIGRIIAGQDYTPEFKTFFDVPLEECIRRDSLREQPIGEVLIRRMHEKYKTIHGETIFHMSK